MKISSIKHALLMLVRAALIFAGFSGCASSRGKLESPLNDSQLPGISSYEQQQNRVQPDISEIKKGKTTEAEVLSILGPPACCVPRRPANSLRRCVAMVFSRVNVPGDDVYVFFDQHGVVTYFVELQKEKALIKASDCRPISPIT